VGIVSLMHTIDPAIVVIGGAMTWGGHDTATGRNFLQAVRAEVRLRGFPAPAEQTRIDYASLGGDAGYLGAAGLARLAYHKSAGAAAMNQALSVETS
jgi:glucokinase